MTAPALVRLPPTALDVAVARAVARRATPRVERLLQVVTWLADEKIVLAGAGALWLHAHLVSRDRAARRRADRLLAAVALAGALPHVFKRLVDRKRPDRAVVHGLRHGIPRSGNRWDSFPSGHAVHLGAAAPMLRAMAPRRLRPLIWPAAAALAATRIALLAHYPSDVAVGLAVGALVDAAADRVLPSPRARKADELRAVDALFLARRGEMCAGDDQPARALGLDRL
jgi:undecaprenyl-diphosphatase